MKNLDKNIPVNTVVPMELHGTVFDAWINTRGTICLRKPFRTFDVGCGKRVYYRLFRFKGKTLVENGTSEQLFDNEEILATKGA